MAYSTSAPPILMFQPMAGIRFWYHTSADATAAADLSGFISNGYFLGMRVGDVVFHKDSTSDATAMTTHKVIGANSSTGAIDLSDGVVVGSATNTD